ncbi:MAG: VWA domain-containing protein [Armatimonadetes bacterium]|nr:VWA domain-containing protein [Armatimonadota bacterium]
MSVVEFARPWALALIVAPLLLAAAALRLGRLTSRRRRLLFLRTATIILLILALAGPRLVVARQGLAVVFVTDLSASVPETGRERAKQFVTEALRRASPGHQVGVIAFGARPHLLVAPRQSAPIPTWPRVESGQTDIAAALKLAIGAFPAGTAKRIVLLSDGNETRGRAAEVAALAQAAGAEISAVPLADVPPREVLVEDLLLPERVQPGSTFTVRVAVRSLRQATARLLLLRDGAVVEEQMVQVRPGRSVIEVPQKLEHRGFYRYQVRLATGEDTLRENNEAASYTVVEGPPSVLYVAGQNQQGPLPEILRKQGLMVEALAAHNLPSSVRHLMGYQAVLLDNVSATGLTPDQLDAMRSYVRDFGGGLVAVGGDRSYGPGGYQRTALDEVLPVSSDVRTRADLPSLAMALVIDASGSMGAVGGEISKLELAKEAARSAVEMLSNQDSVGVIAFDDQFAWAVPLSSAQQRESIIQGIGRIRVGGGTNMYPPLEAAVQALRRTPAKVKHIIALSDGLTPPAPFRQLVNSAIAEGITISGVAVGRDADQVLMRDIAQWGSGRYYFTRDVFSIPQIFALETSLAFRTAIVEEPFRPAAGDPYEGLRGLDLRELPVLQGYVATTAKAAARTALLTRRRDPLLAAWNYGLGRSVAFTSDAVPRWAADWMRWPQLGQFWGQVVRWALREEDERLSVHVSTRDDRGVLLVEAIERTGEPVNFLTLTAQITGPQAEKERTTLRQVGPGRYEGTFATPSVGTYLISLVPSDRKVPVVTGAVVPYSPEFRTVEPNLALLQHLTTATGGTFFRDPQQAFQRRVARGTAEVEIWPWILLMVLALFFGEVLARRLPPFIAAYREWRRLREEGTA